MTRLNDVKTRLNLLPEITSQNNNLSQTPLQPQLAQSRKDNMAGSRWANAEEDAALDAKIKAEKEEKKRLKAEKARKAAEAADLVKLQEQEHAAREAAETQESDSRPAKRRRISPEREEAQEGEQGGGVRRLFRFPESNWQKCRSVEDFEKLNDIEEGAYGWVSRAKDSRTGKVVALKRLKMDNANDGIPVTGLREIQTLLDCNHENIVKLQEVVVGEDMSKIER
jgi:cell division cycle 2-like protein